MPYLLQHLWPGATEAQWYETIKVVLPEGSHPTGKLFYAAAVVDEGVIVTALWESKEDADNFASDVLMTAVPTIVGGVEGEPQELAGETVRVENW